MEKHYFWIRDGNEKTFYHRVQIRNMGFTFSHDGKKWVKEITENYEAQLNEVKRFCKKNHLRFTDYVAGIKRNNTYRDEYFKNTKPFVFDRYVCAYCLKLFKKEQITVDHIIPVKAAQTDAYARYLMEQMNISNINDMENLAAACKKCNSKKGAKCGLWILRGRLGKKRWFFFLYYIAVFFLLAVIIYLLHTRFLLF